MEVGLAVLVGVEVAVGVKVLVVVCVKVAVCVGLAVGVCVGLAPCVSLTCCATLELYSAVCATMVLAICSEEGPQDGSIMEANTANTANTVMRFKELHIPPLRNTPNYTPAPSGSASIACSSCFCEQCRYISVVATREYSLCRSRR